MDLIASHGRPIGISTSLVSIQQGHVTAAHSPSLTKNSCKAVTSKMLSHHCTPFSLPTSFSPQCCCHSCSARSGGSSMHGRWDPASRGDESSKHSFWHLSELCHCGPKHRCLGWSGWFCWHRLFESYTCQQHPTLPPSLCLGTKDTASKIPSLLCIVT